ncbi:MAG: hypothetical protein K6G61_10570 [Solobacterium sp.]|nr:hypothetical protein [Solobacterium sp.]
MKHTAEECRSELRRYYFYDEMIRVLRQRYEVKDHEMTRVRTVQYDKPVSRGFSDTDRIVAVIAQKEDLAQRIRGYRSRMKEIRQASDRMKDRLNAALLWLHFAEDVELRELAEDTGLSVSALSRKIREGLEEMAEAWQ